MKAWFTKLFIPTQENNYAPHSLQKVAVAGMMVLILLTFTVTNVQSLLWIASDWMVSTILPAVIVKETNEERAADSLQTLRRNSVLDQAAQMKAEHMAKNKYFAHYSPDGVSPWYWFGQANYNFVHAGENLAIHFTDSGEVVDAWMKSPTHRANIMNGNYAEIGIGTAEGTYEGFATVYVVQLFGTPAAPAPVVAGESVADEGTPPVALVVEPAVVTVPVAAPTTPAVAVLADDVTITEQVEIVPASAVPSSELVAVPPEVVAESAAVIDDIQVTDSGVALYSDFVATSTGGVPATLTALEPSEVTGVPVAYAALTKPHLVLQVMYGIIGLFVLVSLMLSIFIEIRRQQPLQIAYGVALLALMFGLFYAHALLTTGAVIA